MNTSWKDDYLTKLREILIKYFNEGELRTLCFDLKVDYENLSGTAKADKARELIDYLLRCGRVTELVDIGQQLRPNISWSDSPQQNNQNNSTENILRKRLRSSDWAGYLLTYCDNRCRGNASFIKSTIEQLCRKCVEELDISPLLTALAHPSKKFRRFATKALGELGGRFDIDAEPIVPPLIQRIHMDQDVVTRRYAVWALGAIRPSCYHKQVVEVLRKRLLDNQEDSSVRWKAAWAMGEIKVLEGVSILGHVASNPKFDMSIRRAAIRAIGTIQSSGPYIKKTLRDLANKDKQLERFAKWSLKELEVLEEKEKQRKKAPPRGNS